MIPMIVRYLRKNADNILCIVLRQSLSVSLSQTLVCLRGMCLSVLSTVPAKEVLAVISG